MNAQLSKGRIGWVASFWCALALACLQLSTGTSLLFVQLVFLCFVTGVLAVNLLGGAAELAGFCVLILLAKLVLVSQWMKAIYGEPADAPLLMPNQTMLVMLAGLIGILVAACLTLPFKFKRPALVPIMDPNTLRLAGLLTYAAGTVCCLGTIAGGGEDGMLRVGGMAGIMRQLMFTSKLAVVFTTAAVILRTNGRHSVQWLNFFPIATLFGTGILGASKQTMLDPFLLYGLTVLAFSYRLRIKHWAAVAVLLLFAQLVLFPFAQSARNVIRVFGIKESLQATSEFVKAFSTDAQLRQEPDDDANQDTNYFDRPAAMLGRFGLLKAIDMLVTQTELRGQSGWDTISHGFVMLVPRFINPSKPAVNTGNYLGHKAGLLGENDEGTQVSFGFIADSYSAFGLLGAVLIPFCIVFSFTVVYRWLVGPLWGNVWAVYLFAEFQHSFSEQTIASMIIAIILSPISYVVIAKGIEMCRQWLVKSRPFEYGLAVPPVPLSKTR